MHVHSYMEDQITDVCVRHRRTADMPTCASVCACMGGFGRPHIRAANVRALSVSVGSMWFDSQAFQQATAFNANIGAWNTTRVTMLNSVCAASEGVPDALGRASTRRGRCARACTQVYSVMRASMGVGMAAPEDYGIFVHEYACVGVSLHVCMWVCI